MSRLSIIREPEVIVRSTEPLILASEQYEDYSNSFKYIEALYEEVNNQNELNRYISECLILAENTSPYIKMQKLKALNEDDTSSMSIGDSSSSNRGWFTKVTDFIKKIWGKFVEKITRWVTTNNYYLEKYKDIILKKQPKIGNIQFDGSPCDFNKAYERINQDTIIDLKNLTDIQGVKQLPSKEKDTDLGEMAKLICPRLGSTYSGANSNKAENETFSGWCAEYFEGKVPAAGIKSEIIPSDLNWTMMYNFCHDAENLKNNLNRDKENIFKSATSITEVIKKYMETYKHADQPNRNNMANAVRNVVAHAAVNDINMTAEELKDSKYQGLLTQINKTEEDIKANAELPPPENESADDKATREKDNTVRAQKRTSAESKLKQLKTQLFNQVKQDRGTKIQTNSKKSIEDAEKNAAENKANAVNNTANGESTIIYALDKQYIISEADGSVSISQNVNQNTATANANAAAANTAKIGAQAKDANINVYGLSNDATPEEVDAEIKEVDEKGQFYITTAQNILTGKVTAVEFIYSQFMKIIRAHVESYIGVQGSEGNKVAQDMPTNQTVNAQQAPNQTVDYTTNASNL